MHGGLDLGVVALLAGAVVAWSLVSQRFAAWNISGPTAFVVLGALVADWPLHLVHLSVGSAGVREIAEVTLAVVLFGDAATVDVRKLQRDRTIAARLLLVALPLTIAAGTVVARLLLGTSWWVSAVIGAAVAPTDAALGGPVLADGRIPLRIRRMLNVESGLNDGIATPFVNLFLAAAVAGTALEQTSGGRALAGLALGVLVGGVVGGIGGGLMVVALRRGWAVPEVVAIGVAALALVAYAAVVQHHGNGFIAAFVAGLAYSAATRSADEARDVDVAVPRLRFTHEAGGLLSLVVWFVFGALAVPLLRDARWVDVAFAIAALTVVRMAPVALSLVRSGFDQSTVTVLGWFGPRGLASVVFAVLAVGGLAPDDGQRALLAITATVLLSVVVHGATAGPVGAWYGHRHPSDTNPPSRRALDASG